MVDGEAELAEDHGVANRRGDVHARTEDGEEELEESMTELELKNEGSSPLHRPCAKESFTEELGNQKLGGWTSTLVVEGSTVTVTPGEVVARCGAPPT